MARPYLLDENLRGGGLWKAILQHNSKGNDLLDVLRVGDLPALPLGTRDPDILKWCEREGRILVSLDKNTLPGDLAQHIHAGGHSPGIFLIVKGSRILAIVAFMVLVDQIGDPADFADRIEYIP